MLKAFQFDIDEDGKIKLTKTVDVSPYLLTNKKERNLIGKGFSRKGNLRKVASIPIDVLIAHGIDIHDDNAIRKFLREHPEYRVSEGAV